MTFCWQGILRAKKDFGLDAQFLQSREQADYASNLTLAANRADTVVTLGYLFADSLKEVCPYFPKPASYISKAISRQKMWPASISGPRKAGSSPG